MDFFLVFLFTIDNIISNKVNTNNGIAIFINMLISAEMAIIATPKIEGHNIKIITTKSIIITICMALI